MTADKDRHLHEIVDCLRRRTEMNLYERGYIDAVQEQVGAWMPLTAAQSETVHRIWLRVAANGSLSGDSATGS